MPRTVGRAKVLDLMSPERYGGNEREISPVQNKKKTSWGGCFCRQVQVYLQIQIQQMKMELKVHMLGSVIYLTSQDYHCSTHYQSVAEKIGKV